MEKAEEEEVLLNINRRTGRRVHVVGRKHLRLRVHERVAFSYTFAVILDLRHRNATVDIVCK